MSRSQAELARIQYARDRDLGLIDRQIAQIQADTAYDIARIESRTTRDVALVGGVLQAFSTGLSGYYQQRREQDRWNAEMEQKRLDYALRRQQQDATIEQNKLDYQLRKSADERAADTQKYTLMNDQLDIQEKQYKQMARMAYSGAEASLIDYVGRIKAGGTWDADEYDAVTAPFTRGQKRLVDGTYAPMGTYIDKVTGETRSIAAPDSDTLTRATEHLKLLQSASFTDPNSGKSWTAQELMAAVHNPTAPQSIDRLILVSQSPQFSETTKTKADNVIRAYLNPKAKVAISPAVRAYAEGMQSDTRNSIQSAYDEARAYTLLSQENRIALDSEREGHDLWKAGQYKSISEKGGNPAFTARLMQQVNAVPRPSAQKKLTWQTTAQKGTEGNKVFTAETVPQLVQERQDILSRLTDDLLYAGQPAGAFAARLDGLSKRYNTALTSGDETAQQDLVAVRSELGMLNRELSNYTDIQLNPAFLASDQNLGYAATEEGLTDTSAGALKGALASSSISMDRQRNTLVEFMQHSPRAASRWLAWNSDLTDREMKSMIGMAESPVTSAFDMFRVNPNQLDAVTQTMIHEARGAKEKWGVAGKKAIGAAAVAGPALAAPAVLGTGAVIEGGPVVGGVVQGSAATVGALDLAAPSIGAGVGLTAASVPVIDAALSGKGSAKNRARKALLEFVPGEASVSRAWDIAGTPKSMQVEQGTQLVQAYLDSAVVGAAAGNDAIFRVAMAKAVKALEYTNEYRDDPVVKLTLFDVDNRRQTWFPIYRKLMRMSSVPTDLEAIREGAARQARAISASTTAAIAPSGPSTDRFATYTESQRK